MGQTIMSRTDAHMPHWVTATWYEPVHDHRCRFSDRWMAGYGGRDPRPCDLPDRAVRHRPGAFRRPGRQLFPGETRCSWEPDWFGVSRWPRPQRWFVEHVWHNPERVRVRDLLRLAAAEHRGSGGTDVEPEPRQARHGAHWYWA